MNKNFIKFGLFAMALSMAACSQDDLASELNEVEAIEGVAEAPEVVSGYAASTRSVYQIPVFSIRHPAAPGRV